MQLLCSTRRGQRNNGVGNGNGCGQSSAAILLLPLCLLLALIATVASVPTSVLAQDTEMSNSNTFNANNNDQKTFMPLQQQQKLQLQLKQQQQLQQAQQPQLPKVKRSSNNNNKNGNGFASNEMGASSSTLAPSTSQNLDKKSSPEIVPASFSNLPPAGKSNAAAAANNNNNNNNNQPQAGLYALPSNSEIMAAVEAAAVAANSQQQQQQQFYGDADDVDSLPISSMHKRGINAQQYLYDAGLTGSGYLGAGAVAGNADYYGNPYGQSGYEIAVPNGVWTDEMEPAASYADLQELDDYVPVQRNGGNNRNKAYDNLQNLLNTEAYLESVPLSVPLQYANRNYGILDAERNKRGGYYNANGGSAGSSSNLNKFNGYADIRNHKRDNTKLTPADMLALVALVEAGERARKETDADAGYAYPADNYAPKSYGSGLSASATGAGVGANGGIYDYGSTGNAAALDDIDYNAGSAGTGQAAGNWLDAPAVVDYYGVPVNVEAALPKYDFVPREHKYGNGNRYGGSSKRFMVAKKKRSVGKYLNNGEKFY